MMLQKKKDSFWESVLSPVTKVSVAITRMKVGKYSNDNKSEGEHKLGHHSDMKTMLFLSTAAKNALKGKGPEDRDEISAAREKIKTAILKEGRVLDEKKHDLAPKKDKLSPNQRKQVEELEKRILGPYAASKDKQMNFFVSNSHVKCGDIKNNNYPMPLNVTRRISVQSIDSYETSPNKDATVALKEIDCNLSAEQHEQRQSGSVWKSSTHNKKHGSVMKRPKFLEPIESFRAGLKTEENKSFAREEKRRVPKTPHDLFSANVKSLDGGNHDGFTRSDKIKNGEKLTIQVSLPNVESTFVTDPAAAKTRAGKKNAQRGKNTIPRIKSSFSTKNTLQNSIYTEDDNDIRLLDYKSLTAGAKKRKKRNEHSNLWTDDSGTTQILSHQNKNEEKLDSYEKTKSNDGKKAASKKDKVKATNGKEIIANDANNGEIKSIMKKGTSHQNGNTRFKRERRVSFSKRTIRTFVPDKVE